jgi:hypothetical protein
MLKTGFLGTLSDWVSEQTAKDEAVMDAAARKFGLEKLLHTAEEPEKILGLFSEWLVFDYRQDIFNGRTGLQFFIEHNPLALVEQEFSAYKDMLDFEVGLFEVKDIERGKGVTLASIASGKERFVHDVNASLSLRGTETVWTRIAPIDGLYHGVGSLFLVLPMRMMSGMREAIAGWKKNSFDAREAAKWASHPPEPERAHEPSSYEESRRRFVSALKKCGMEGFFSLETFAEWVSNEGSHDPLFAARALDCLIPENTEFKATQEMMRYAGEFSNNIPRKTLGGKTPNEAMRERIERREEGDWETDMFSKEKYMKTLAKAHEYMKHGEFEKSFKAFEQVIKDLYKEKLPFVSAFRIYANAAVCCFYKDEPLLGDALLDAALRINPLYEFATRQKERYATTYDPTLVPDFASLPKKGQKMLQGLLDDMRATGKSMYQHRIFSKYEKFLKELGVSLAYNARVERTVYSFDEDGNPTQAPKIGRNDPCLCGSGKKYKKCCGR